MKLILIIMAAICAQSVFADSFSLTKDGKDYLCEQVGPLDPNGAVACMNKAYNGPFSRDQATQICRGAQTTAPAECGIKAYNGPFNLDQAVMLCMGAKSLGPVDCGIKAYNGPFNLDQATRLCRGGTVANAECGIKAYNGPFNLEQAIAACQSNPSGALIVQGEQFIKVDSVLEKLNSFKIKTDALKTIKK